MPDPSRTSDTDQVTYQLLLDGKEDGLVRLLNDHGGRVRAALRVQYGSSVDDSAIDEALTEAAYRVYRFIGNFAPEQGSLLSWFYMIARNAIQDILRRESRSAHLPLETLDMAEASVVDSARQDELTDLLRSALDSLPELQKKIIEADLAAGGAATTPELANSLGITTNAVYAIRHRARQRLREQLSKVMDVDEDTAR